MVRFPCPTTSHNDNHLLSSEQMLLANRPYSQYQLFLHALLFWWEIFGSLSRGIFEWRTSTGNEVFSLLNMPWHFKIRIVKCLTLAETVTCPNIWAKPPLKNKKKIHFQLRCIAQKCLCLAPGYRHLQCICPLRNHCASVLKWVQRWQVLGIRSVTKPRVQRKSFLQLAIQASWS